MKGKQGISQVISIVVIVVLVLIAIAVVWGVFGNIIGEQSSEATLVNQCTGIEVKPTMATCTGGDCDVTVTRSASGDDISGVKVIYTDDTGANYIDTVEGNIEPLKALPLNTANTGLAGNVTKVEVSAYLTTETGEEYICPAKFSYTVQ